MADFGEVLKAAGEFGRFQKGLVFLLGFPNLFTAFHMFGQVFTGISVPHHCNTDWILAISPNLTIEEQLNLTIPRTAEGTFDECLMYTPVDWDIDLIERYGLNATQKCQNGWVYDTSEQTSTLVTEFDLVCDQKEQNDISQSIYMLGLLLGSLILGPLGDRIGRCPVIFISLLLQLVFGVGAVFVQNFYVYTALRCIVGIGIPGILINSLVLVAEWVGVTQRAFAATMTHIWNASGLMVLAGLSYATRSWRLLQLVGSMPVAAVFFYIWILPESPRWLLTRGKSKEAKRLLQKAAATNKRKIPEDLLNQLSNEEKPASGNMLHLFRNRRQCKITFISCLIWFVNSMVYYGLSFNVGSFGLDIYLTQLIFGIVEIPACILCIFLLELIGRKKSQAGYLLLGGATCLLITVIPKDVPVAVTVLAVVGKFLVTGSFSVCYVYSAELFPTVVRQNGVGLASTFARIGGIIAPLITLLGKYHPAIPMAIYGSGPVIVGILCFMLPETHNKQLQDHTEETAGDQGSMKPAVRGLENCIEKQEDNLKSSRF